VRGNKFQGFAMQARKLTGIGFPTCAQPVLNMLGFVSHFRSQRKTDESAQE
jgi:hypothetical protein